MGETKRTVLICQGTACVSSDSPLIQQEIEKHIEAEGLDNIDVKLTGCHGFCQRGPIVIVEPEGIFYTEVKVEDASDIVTGYLKGGQPVERLLYSDPDTNETISRYADVPFYKGQRRDVVLRNCGHINPEVIEDYVAVDGYAALKSVVSGMEPGEVIEAVKASGLRGRGGAGFPTGLKWEFCAREQSDEKYIICNADEGDPGAFMDRSVLEADPHSLVEGMIIAGYAIGASVGHIYVRAEYPLAVKRIRLAIDQARDGGYLGEKILGGDFSFDISIMEGAGAFVCGEETALIASLEGEAGRPRPKPPFPAQSGLWGKPTTINNVKTLASIPVILGRGHEWFAELGTEKSKGTAVFAITGHIANSGLVEVAMGTTLREIVFDIGGGVPDGRKFKAVQTGGPSGGCLPESFLDTPVDFDSLNKAGAIMGSGGIVVMDESTCMVDVARYFIDFTQKESCGECVPCRMGTKQMLRILEDITAGKGKPGDIELLEEMASSVKLGSLCGLGQTAPNPVLTTIRYFRDEYEDHIQQGICPARVCKALIHYRINPDKCIGCTNCARACPVGAVSGEKKSVHTIDQETCIQCGMCHSACPTKVQAVEVLTGEETVS